MSTEWVQSKQELCIGHWEVGDQCNTHAHGAGAPQPRSNAMQGSPLPCGHVVWDAAKLGI
uniref:Uncharacterized protein n=1 Tax=Physcomitrium patens TaxID=3218 RepID=A0A2K1J214_PHYPA|nr:hypothetical protein PHYPA_023475 [Physcomitrium patens]